MKVNRMVALAMVALLAIGAMGFISSRSLAQTQTPKQQAQVTVAPSDAAAEEPEDAAAGPDTDTLEEQVGEQAGEQVEDGQPDGAEAPDADSGPDEQTPSYAGSITVDQAAADGMSEADEAAALAGQATITSDDAQAAALAANPGTTVSKVELDNENGVLVYSVELSNGADVKVDAGNAAILYTDAGGDNEG